MKKDIRKRTVTGLLCDGFTEILGTMFANRDRGESTDVAALLQSLRDHIKNTTGFDYTLSGIMSIWECWIDIQRHPSMRDDQTLNGIAVAGER